MCLYVYVDRQELDESVAVAMNACTETEKLLEMPFSVQSMLYETQVCGCGIARQQLGKHIHTATNGCWRQSMLYQKKVGYQLVLIISWRQISL
jgi:hypothetical protein